MFINVFFIRLELKISWGLIIIVYKVKDVLKFFLKCLLIRINVILYRRFFLNICEIFKDINYNFLCVIG